MTERSASERTAAAQRAIALIDLTDLSDDHAHAGIDALCARARAHGTAAVCVWPEFVSRCSSQLSGSDVRVATVVNFPSGDNPLSQVVAMTHGALDDGADDIDVVLPYRAFLAGDVARASELLRAVTSRVEAPRIVKVILETGALPDEPTVRSAAELAIECGADFVKTSTGKIPAGASLEAARAMLEVIAAADRPIGLKPSGGIRTFDDAMAYLELADSVMGQGWATPATFRFGASGLLDALLAVVRGGPDVTGSTSY
jgi:deoxyribose-phosphate aldolase